MDELGSERNRTEHYILGRPRVCPAQAGVARTQTGTWFLWRGRRLCGRDSAPFVGASGGWFCWGAGLDWGFMTQVHPFPVPTESREKAGLRGFQKHPSPPLGVPQRHKLRAAGAGRAQPWFLLPGDLERVERPSHLSHPAGR